MRDELVGVRNVVTTLEREVILAKRLEQALVCSPCVNLSFYNIGPQPNSSQIDKIVVEKLCRLPPEGFNKQCSRGVLI
jgi:hypothetical protein